MNNLENITQFFQIEKDFLNLLENYKNDKKKYEKEVISYIISQTKNNPEAIRLFTNNFKNNKILKQYLGTKKSELTKTINIFRANNIHSMFELFGELVLSPNTTKTLKKDIISSLNSTNTLKSIEYISNNIFNTLSIEDLSWIVHIDKRYFEKYFNTTESKNSLLSFLISLKNEVLKSEDIDFIKLYRNVFQLTLSSSISTDETFDLNLNKEVLEVGLFLVNKLKDKENPYSNEFIYSKQSFLLNYINKFKKENLITISLLEKEFDFSFEEFSSSYNQFFSETFGNRYSSSFKSFFLNTQYEEFLTKTFFDKAREQINDLIYLTEYTKNMSEEQLSNMKSFINKSPWDKKVEDNFWPFLNKFKNHGKWIDYNVILLEPKELFLEKNIKLYTDLIDTCFSNIIDMRLLNIFHNEGNMTCKTIVKTIYSFYFSNNFNDLFFSSSNIFNISDTFKNIFVTTISHLKDNISKYNKVYQQKLSYFVFNKNKDFFNDKDFFLTYNSLEDFNLFLLKFYNSNYYDIKKQKLILNKEEIDTKIKNPLLNKLIIDTISYLNNEVNNYINFLEIDTDYDVKLDLYNFIVIEKPEMIENFIKTVGFQNSFNLMEIKNIDILNKVFCEVADIIYKGDNLKYYINIAIDNENNIILDKIKELNIGNNSFNVEIAKYIENLQNKHIEKNPSLLPNSLVKVSQKERSETIDYLNKELLNIFNIK